MNLFILQNVRANNFSKDTGQVIGEAWASSMSIVNGQAVTLYGVYHEYESDYKGDYTLSIGTESIETTDSLKIPEAKYQIFPVDSSKETGVFEAWQGIWQLEEQGELKRSYTFDYERYNTDGSVEIFIAIK